MEQRKALSEHRFEQALNCVNQVRSQAIGYLVHFIQSAK